MLVGKNSIRLTMTWTFFSQRHLSSLLCLRSRRTSCGNFNFAGRLLNWYDLHWSHRSCWDQLEKSLCTILQPCNISKCNSCILPNILASKDMVDLEQKPCSISGSVTARQIPRVLLFTYTWYNLHQLH